MAFRRRSSALAVRRSVTSSPKYRALQARVSSLAKRSRAVAGRNEGTLLVLAGAAAPALITRFSGKALPTFAGIDPAILYGGLAMVIATQTGGRTRERLMAVGTGIAAPGIARAVATGTIKVSGDDDEVGAQIEDADVGAI